MRGVTKFAHARRLDGLQPREVVVLPAVSPRKWDNREGAALAIRDHDSSSRNGINLATCIISSALPEYYILATGAAHFSMRNLQFSFPQIIEDGYTRPSSTCRTHCAYSRALKVERHTGECGAMLETVEWYRHAPSLQSCGYLCTLQRPALVG
jgi:hypothetical protein